MVKIQATAMGYISKSAVDWTSSGNEVSPKMPPKPREGAASVKNAREKEVSITSVGAITVLS